jgi:cytochrome P450
MTSTHTDDPSQCPVVGFPWGEQGRTPLRGIALVDQLQSEYAACPVLKIDPGDRFEEFFMLTDHAMILEVMQQSKVFSSYIATPEHFEPDFMAIPIMLDGEEHTKWRQFLSPFFSPPRMRAREIRIRQRCRKLVERVAGSGGCDVVGDFAAKFPTSVFLELMGLPEDELDQFMAWEDALLHGDDKTDPERSKMLAAVNSVMAYFAELLALRRSGENDESRDDLLSDAITWETDGEPVPDDQLLGFCLLLFMAGLDTVTAALSYSFFHLANDPEDRSRVANEPGIRDRAVEELLRAYPFVQSQRRVLVDMDFHGWSLKAGDAVVLPLAAAGRDEKIYPSAKEVDLDRESIRHLSFGAGPHRCLGSHLARLELRIALDEWHRLIPDYHVAPNAVVTETSGSMWGIRSLPLEWST